MTTIKLYFNGKMDRDVVVKRQHVCDLVQQIKQLYPDPSFIRVHSYCNNTPSQSKMRSRIQRTFDDVYHHAQSIRVYNDPSYISRFNLELVLKHKDTSQVQRMFEDDKIIYTFKINAYMHQCNYRTYFMDRDCHMDLWANQDVFPDIRDKAIKLIEQFNTGKEVWRQRRHVKAIIRWQRNEAERQRQCELRRSCSGR